MQTTITPYIFFAGRCEEALEFYKGALGAKVGVIMRFNESPDPTPPGMLQEGFEEKIMHVDFTINGAMMMASDGCSDQEGKNQDGYKIALAVPTEAEARSAFDALSKGGTISMPLNTTFWSPLFGMLTDKFGIGWMVMVQSEQSE